MPEFEILGSLCCFVFALNRYFCPILKEGGWGGQYFVYMFRIVYLYTIYRCFFMARRVGNRCECNCSWPCRLIIGGICHEIMRWDDPPGYPHSAELAQSQRLAGKPFYSTDLSGVDAQRGPLAGKLISGLACTSSADRGAFLARVVACCWLFRQLAVLLFAQSKSWFL